uniref:F-box domain-containing protein n=1 Tax=viral metagenome TaxID=1070528 RepID=A0A6C0AXY6_9ZZZZ
MNKQIYNLPDELQLYIISYIPKTKCLYCYIYLLSFENNIYCSNSCCIYHNLVILNRISHILFFSFIIQLKIFIMLSANFSILLITMFLMSSFIKIMYKLYCFDLLFHMEISEIY